MLTGCDRTDLRPGEQFIGGDGALTHLQVLLRVVGDALGKLGGMRQEKVDVEGARLIEHLCSGMQGRSFPIGGDVVANLDGTGFNDRASSIRVEEGYWIFCSDAQFQGDCQTFGPGDYATLPWGLDRKISSGRRIHERYPYNGRPDWNR